MKKGIILYMVLGWVRYRGVFCELFLHFLNKNQEKD